MARDTHVAKIKPQTLYFHCASLLAQSFSNPSAIKNYWSTKDDSALRKDVGNKAEGRISNRVFQKKQSTQIFRKTNISYPLIPTRTCAYQGVRNVRFFGKFDVLCFLETPVLWFVLLPYYRRFSGFTVLMAHKMGALVRNGLTTNTLSTTLTH